MVVSVCQPIMRSVHDRHSFTGMMLLVAAVLMLLVPQSAQARIPASQPVVELVDSHKVYTRASFASKSQGVIKGRRPITESKTVLPVLSRSRDAKGRLWLRVLRPGRVLGAVTPPRAGWIRSVRVRNFETPWHLVVARDARRVLVYYEGRRLRSFRAVVGAPDTPTPSGRYFVEESIRLAAGYPGAPFALALSARSRVFQEFDGGPGQVALHGRNNIGGELGTAVSHGCVRLTTSNIRWLALRISPGAPVTIR